MIGCLLFLHRRRFILFAAVLGFLFGIGDLESGGQTGISYTVPVVELLWMSLESIHSSMPILYHQ